MSGSKTLVAGFVASASATLDPGQTGDSIVEIASATPVVLTWPSAHDWYAYSPTVVNETETVTLVNAGPADASVALGVGCLWSDGTSAPKAIKAGDSAVVQTRYVGGGFAAAQLRLTLLAAPASSIGPVSATGYYYAAAGGVPDEYMSGAASPSTAYQAVFQHAPTAVSSGSAAVTATITPNPSASSSVSYAAASGNVQIQHGTYANAVAVATQGIVRVLAGATSFSGANSRLIGGQFGAQMSGGAAGAIAPGAAMGIATSNLITDAGWSTTIPSVTGVYASAFAGSGAGTGTVTTARAGYFFAPTLGAAQSIATNVGVDVVPFASATGIVGTNVGLRVSAPTNGTVANMAVQLSDTSGLASGGLTFGTTSGQSNLYRSAASTLKTDTAFEVGTALRVDGNVGFYNTAPVAKPTVTGSRAGNAALASLLTALASMGLVVDSSTA